MSTGKVIQVIGPVVDVEFPPGQLPNIYNALKVTQEENKAAGKPAVRITLEVASHLGENRVRGIAMSTTDGLTRGMDVQDTGAPISVPVGRETLGRLINVLGEPVDEKGPIKAKKTYPIHRPAPRLEDQDTKTANARSRVRTIRRNIRRTVTPDFCKVNAKAGGDCARMIRAMLDPLPGFRLA